MWSLLFDYQFLTVAGGTLLLALAAASIGSISVFSQQSLVGDALGHAAYPGIILAFMLFQSKHPLLLVLGAMGAGFLAYSLVQLISRYSPHSQANALTLVSASFFGLGMVLKNYIQGHPAFADSSQAGLQTYLFGQATFIKLADVYLIAGLASLCLILFYRHYQAYKIYLFDHQLSATLGIKNRQLQVLNLLLLVSLIAVGLKLVGALLMSAFLIAPTIFGSIWGKHYLDTLVYASSLAASTSLIGTYLSTIILGLSTGPTMIILMSSAIFISLIYHHKFRKA